jgi:hypothetical protein
MPFVIIDEGGEPLTDVAGELIALDSADEAATWAPRAERVEHWAPERIRRWKTDQRP